jgi:hypothetical protein
MKQLDTRPWHLEPWPWILMAGPFVVVVAGLLTAWIAVKTSDGLVTEDYYKKGLAINQTLTSSEQARKVGLLAGIRITGGILSVRLQATTDPAFLLPSKLLVSISHPTRAGLDQSSILVRSGNTYHGPVHLPVAGHWLVLLEDEKKTWRLLGNVVLPANGETMIGMSGGTAMSASGAHKK